MRYNYLNRVDSEKYFVELEAGINASVINDRLTEDYKDLRDDLLQINNSLSNYKDYEFDLLFALELYDYFDQLDDFTETLASNYDFWRYLSIKVVPEIIINRHGYVSEYFYSKNVRIYLCAMWWYIHLCWQGSKEKTYDCLKDLSTDYILQLTERPGKTGVYLPVTRKIIKKISSFPTKVRNAKVGGANLFRRIMILNHTMIENYNLLIDNNVDKYINELLNRCNING